MYTPSELDEYMISILLAFLSTRSKSARELVERVPL